MAKIWNKQIQNPLYHAVRGQGIFLVLSGGELSDNACLSDNIELDLTADVRYFGGIGHPGPSKGRTCPIPVSNRTSSATIRIELSDNPDLSDFLQEVRKHRHVIRQFRMESRD